MILPDTCVWIEVLRGTKVGEHFRPLLRSGTQLVVPTIVQFELWKWVARELSEEEADRAIAVTRSGNVIAMDERIALTAAELSLKHALAAADAMIYATSLTFQAKLVTCDAHFKGLPQVEYSPK